MQLKSEGKPVGEHGKYNRLSKSFPEVITREKVEEKWETYLQMKQKAKDLVAEKMQQERNVVLEEFRKTGGYGVVFSGKK